MQSGQNIYNYKNAVHVPSLGFVDDGVGIAPCGDESLNLNIITEEMIKAKKLRFNTDKCHVIHVGKSQHNCANLKVHGVTMKRVENEKYLGQ